MAVTDQQQAQLGTQAQEQEPVFPFRMFVVVKLNCVLVIENGLSFFERNAVFLRVGMRFFESQTKCNSFITTL